LFENIASLDIGTSSVKLVAVRTGLTDFQVKSLAYEDINQSIENRNEALIDALSRLTRDFDFSGYRIITNLPMEKVILRNITFPFSDVEKIAEAIPYEAEENIPFKIEDLVMDFQPMKSGNPDEGRVLLAATHKENLYEFIRSLGDAHITPIRMGMEAGALFESYKYFNKIQTESIIQIDIGNSKTIINIIQDSSLLYTRSIPIGLRNIITEISDGLKMNPAEAARIFEGLNLDLTSYENNLQKSSYKAFNITRQRLQRIFDIATDVFDDLLEQIVITIKALEADFRNIALSRAMISGGGSGVHGFGSMLSNVLDIPVVAHPFLDEYKDPRIQAQFPIAFGTILGYMRSKRSSINFLKGEFLPDIASSSKKIYYLAGGFAVLTGIMLVIKLLVTFIITAKSNSDYNSILEDLFKRNFHSTAINDDPITDASKILQKEKADLSKITNLIPDDTSVLEALKDVIAFFPRDNSFDLKNLVINERVLRLDGTIGSSKAVDDFKENLIRSRKFDSVTLNISSSSKNLVSFSLTIKQKLQKQEKKGRG